ncbi:MAG: hypothetical protein ACF8MJ_12580 [Phycisphaerales bacterium JB050]
MIPRRSTRERAAGHRSILLPTAALLLTVGTTHAIQDSGSAPPVFDGRTFANINLPSDAQALPISFRAIRAWSWAEATATGGTDRLLLEGDVRVEIGGYDFTATRAVVWIEPVEVVAASGVRAEADQLAIYLENVRDPGGRPGSEPGVGQSADRLLVTGLMVRQPSGIALRSDEVVPSRPTLDRLGTSPAATLNAEGEARLAAYLAGLQSTSTTSQALERPPRTDVVVERVPPQDPYALADANTFDDTRPELPANPGRIIQPGPSMGTVTFSSPQIVVEPDDESGGYAVMFTDGVGVTYELDGRAGSRQLTAERAVVFLEKGADAASGTFRSTEVAGVYLEGDVNLIAVDSRPSVRDLHGAGSNRYTLRGSRVYYDLRSDRAVLLDAVFWTYDAERGMPLYLRAESIRQESDAQFTAEKATLANVAFADPHFSIGADSITLTRSPRSNGSMANSIDAKGVGFRIGDFPVLGLPRLRGEFRNTPLRRIGFESEGGSPILRTEWDLYTIFGIDTAPNQEALLLIDGYLDRGAGIGLDMTWNTPDTDGTIFGYYIYDNGEDRFTTGETLDRDSEHRGLFRTAGRYRLDEVWTLFGELSYVSDEAFVDAFFEREAEVGREFVSSLYARRIDPNGPEISALEFEARASLNDFLVNEHLLQSPGYQTERLPEATYSVVGDDLFGGVLTYYGQTRAGLIKLNLAENNLADQGYTNQIAQDAFGINANQTVADRLRSEGYNTDDVLRFDSRHEIEIPMTLDREGLINFTPFAVGRITAYDTDFDSYRTVSGSTEEDEYRLWGAVGARLGTSFVKVDNSFGSELFDLTRMRHIVEPTATVWFSDQSLNDDSLPIYDDSVEGIADGFTYRLGLRNTWQTKRGPSGNMRSVDWLVLDTNYTWSDDDVPVDSPYGRFIEYRPEYSNYGEFVSNRATMLLTDALALTADWTYDTDANTTRRITTGAMIDHGYGYSSFFEYRSLDVVDSDLLQAGSRYELTRKYAVEVYGSWNLDEDEFQIVGSRIERRFPQWTLDIGVDYDNIEDSLSVGVSFRPVGLGSETRTRVFTQDEDAIDVLASPSRLRATRLNSGPFAQ